MKKDKETIYNGEISPLALIRWASSEYEELITNEIGEHKILNQNAVRSILKILTLKNGISQNELAREVHLKGSTVSVALVKMENENLIKREDAPNDKRKVNVYLTSSGYELVKFLESIGKKAEEKMLSGLNDSEKYDLEYCLTKILNNAK